MTISLEEYLERRPVDPAKLARLTAKMRQYALSPDGLPTVWVDHSRLGVVDRFTSRAPLDLAHNLSVDDLVWVTDDDVDPYLCRVAAVVHGGKYIRYERVPGGPATATAAPPGTA